MATRAELLTECKARGLSPRPRATKRELIAMLEHPSSPDEPVLRSATGVALDPEDGRPVFADGMSRRRWLAATRPARHAQLVAELRAVAEGEEA